ncbi:MAG: ABC transporter substrate-binding protein [Curvibacter sp. PD_MW3]|nr:tripartite tricarboxylate transporter substrate binding protein [Burkholderiales bacterium]PHM20315.1 MAG: ABC transporter substrate-binding protein [Curvibacter sp. PD_MW3]
MKRRDLLQAAAILGLPSLSFAQDKYPGKPITIICPYPAGGNTDQRSRQFGRFISTALGQPVVVDNKPGAGGNIGTEAIVRAKPDGYTIGMGNFAPLSVNPTMFKKVNFDPLKDLAPICLIERGPLVLMVRPDSPFKSVKDIVAAAKAKPGYLTYANGGTGGSHHLAAEMFKNMAGVFITNIPYKGGAPAAMDLMGGQVDMMFEQMYAASANIRAGKLRPLAITSLKRSPQFPDVPTMAEQGFPGYEISNWQGLVAPAATPKPIIQLLNEVTNKALADPTIKAQMLSQGNELGGGTPEQFAAHIKAEAARWSKLVKSAGITTD